MSPATDPDALASGTACDGGGGAAVAIDRAVAGVAFSAAPPPLIASSLPACADAEWRRCGSGGAVVLAVCVAVCSGCAERLTDGEFSCCVVVRRVPRDIRAASRSSRPREAAGGAVFEFDIDVRPRGVRGPSPPLPPLPPPGCRKEGMLRCAVVLAVGAAVEGMEARALCRLAVARVPAAGAVAWVLLPREEGRLWWATASALVVAAAGAGA